MPAARRELQHQLPLLRVEHLLDRLPEPADHPRALLEAAAPPVGLLLRVVRDLEAVVLRLGLLDGPRAAVAAEAPPVVPREVGHAPEPVGQNAPALVQKIGARHGF